LTQAAARAGAGKVAHILLRSQQASQTIPRGQSGLPAPTLLLVALCLSGCVVANAAEPGTNEFIPDLPNLWLHDVDLRASVGYKDNLTLGRKATEKSYLIGSGVDVTVARLPLDGKQFNFLLSVDDTRYPQGKEVTHEDLIAERIPAIALESRGGRV